MTFKGLDTRLESTVVLVFNSRKIYMLLWVSLPLFLILILVSSPLLLSQISVESNLVGEKIANTEFSKTSVNTTQFSQILSV